MADDLGIGDVSAFGNTSLITPNIDRIGREGALLTHHLAAASLCTPSRSAFLTGRYPIRTGMASPHTNRVFLFIASKGGLPSNETTFAKALKGHNYGTALIGKWHLGNDCHNYGDGCHHPLNHGFDYFYGIPLTNLKDFGNDGASVVLSFVPQFFSIISTLSSIGFSLSLVIYFKGYSRFSLLLLFLMVVLPMLALVFQQSIKLLNSVLMRGHQVIEQPIQLEGITDRLVSEAKDFMSRQRGQQKPFLLVLNFIKVHSAHFPNKEFKGKSGFGLYGDCVLEMDSGVGKILDFLNEKHLKDNTIVYFSSDNGGHLEEVGIHGQQEGGSNGLFKGGKAQGAMEGGIRVPTAMMWPKRIPAQSVISVPTSQMDIFTTIHDLLDIPLPTDRIIDGKSILPLLSKPESNSSPHEFLYHYCGSYLHGVRYVEDIDNVWKLYFFRPKFKSGEYKCEFVCMCSGDHVIEYNPPLLYNLVNDTTEDNSLDISSHQKYERVVEIMLNAVKAHKLSIKAVPSQFGLWNSVWRPWLQPCCQFPSCSCREKSTN